MNARARLQQALQCHLRGEQDAAITLCEGIPPGAAEYVEALRIMGASLRQAGRPDEALPCFERAVAVDPLDARAHFDLAYHLASQGRPEMARRAFDRVLALDPAHQGALVNQGLVLSQCGEYEEARRCLERALERNPRDAAAAYNLGLWHLLQGDLASGWAGYRHRFVAKGVPPRTFTEPRWKGERLGAGEGLLVAVEQGMGDLLQFVRYMPRLREYADRVFLECPAALLGVLARSPGVDVLVRQGDSVAGEGRIHRYTPMLDVPGLLGTTLESIPRPVPYLFAEASRVSRWARRTGPDVARGDDFRVGLVWSGNPLHENDRHRSIPLELLVPLAGVPGVRFFGLQAGAARSQAAPLAHVLPMDDLGADFADFEDTAAAVAQMDLVISVDTSVAHLAGGMGTPTWLLVPFHPDWRWLLDRTDSPWYPTMRLFRQATPRDWEPVVREVRQALVDLASPPLAVACPADAFEPLVRSVDATAEQEDERPHAAPSSMRSGRRDSARTACGTSDDATVAPRPRAAIVTPDRTQVTPLDEIGLFMLRRLLPGDTPHVEVPLSEVDTLDDVDLDLLIVGCGGLLPVLDPPPALVGLVERVPRSIGLFGVHSPPGDVGAGSGRFRALVTGMTAWFVRTAEDLLLHGRDLENVAWAGDWRLAALPDTDAGPLDVGHVEWTTGEFTSPEEFVACVQSFQRVVSSQADVLLSALPSAAEVAWRPVASSDAPDWNTRALILDVLGCPLSAGVLVPVDRQAVIAYRAQCAAAFVQLRHLLHNLGDTRRDAPPHFRDSSQNPGSSVSCPRNSGWRTSVRCHRNSVAVGGMVPRGASILLCGDGEEELRRQLPPGCGLSTDESAVAQAPDIAVTLDLPLAHPAGEQMMQRLMAPHCSILACCRLASTPMEREDAATPVPAPDESLARLIGESGLYVQNGISLDEEEVLLQLDASPPYRPAPCRILLIAPPGQSHAGHAQRLWLLRSLMPPHTHLDLLDPWSSRVPDAAYDLVILGAGNSFGPALLGSPQRRTRGVAENLLSILEKTPRRLGYFGTQFRRELDEAFVEQVLIRLHVWLARTTSDLAAHGCGSVNAVTLGDLLLAAEEPWHEQGPESLHATHLTPLLAALPRLRSFTWHDSHSPHGEPSGRFESVLGDVFAGSVPEGRRVDVDHKAVAGYRCRMKQAVEDLRDTIRALLEA